MPIFYMLLFAFAISAPIFYLWGVAAFFQTVFGNKDTPSNRLQSQNEEQSKFVELFFQRVEEEPNLTLEEFHAEVREAKMRRIMANQAVATRQSAPVYESTATDESARIADLMSAPSQSVTPREEPKPEFSWSAWYADHSIDFILYLGAFMIVAAVSLFVGFQWENFGGLTRFGIVVGFTIAWYGAGFAVQRFLSLDGVAIAFITIGAIITPFCGVAWQRFVIGTMDNVGITWLITSLIGTGIYMLLSLVYQRRHFTYFGNLSILAMMMSLVEVTSSPDEFFILAGTLTALVLLAGRVAMKMLAPRLDAYLGQDFEWSSLAILLFSLVAGLMLLSSVGLAFFSIEVLAVLISTLLYVGLYLTLHFNGFTIALIQALIFATLSHALVTFDVDARLSLYVVMIASVVLQFAVNLWLEERHPDIFLVSNSLGLLISGIVYGLTVIVTGEDFLAIPILLLLIGHAIYYAIKLENPYAWYLVSILFYPLLAHGLFGFNIGFEYWASAYIVLAAIQLVPLLSELDKTIIEAFAYLGLIAIGIAGFVSLSLLSSFASLTSLARILLMLNPFVVLACYAIVMLQEARREEALFSPIFPIVLATASIVYYFISSTLEPTLIPILMALSISVLFWLAQSIIKNNPLYYVVFAAPYFALYHILFAYDLTIEIYPIAYAILSALIFFAIILPDESDLPRQIVSLVGLGLVSAAAFSYAIGTQSVTMHYSGWVGAYTFLGMLYLSRSILGKSLGDGIFVIATLVQYYWHIIFLQQFVSYQIFSNLQWFSAPIASVLLGISLVIARDNEDDGSVFGIQVIGAAILMLPTLGQILDSQSLLYFGIGVTYSLIIGAIAISFSHSRLRTIAAISLVLVVLSQSSDFLLSLPRWIVIGVIGFGLIGAGLYLSIRRRSVKKQA